MGGKGIPHLDCTAGRNTATAAAAAAVTAAMVCCCSMTMQSFIQSALKAKQRNTNEL